MSTNSSGAAVVADDWVPASVDRRYNTLGPLPDLYEISYPVGVGFQILASVLVLLMQLG